MSYQDRIVQGVVAKKGYRECHDRYGLLKEFCSGLGRPFTVLDVGANWCYFPLRLTADFDCKVVAVEPNNYALRQRHLRENAAKNIVLMNHRFTIESLRSFSRCCQFDLVLALSVIHHIPGSMDEIVRALWSCGDSLIVEFAVDDSARVKAAELLRVEEFIRCNRVLGYGASHKSKEIRRPIVAFSTAREAGAAMLERVAR